MIEWSSLAGRFKQLGRERVELNCDARNTCSRAAVALARVSPDPEPERIARAA